MTFNANLEAGSQPQFAGFWARIAASAIDLLVVVFILGMIQPFAPGAWYTVAAFAVPLAYYAVLLSLKGRTLGQWVFRQVTVTSTYQRILAVVAIKRAGWILLSYALLGLPLLTILFSSKRQALHDFMADTVVIRQSDKSC